MRAEVHRKEATNPCLCGSTSSDEIPCGSPAIVCCHLRVDFEKLELSLLDVLAGSLSAATMGDLLPGTCPTLGLSGTCLGWEPR